jgi:hypothetical protein
MSRRTILISTVSAVAVALALTGCGVARGPASPDAPGPSGPSATATSTVPGLNTPVTVGAFQFTAIDVKDAGTTVGSSVLTQTAQGTYLQVDLKVANTGNKAATFIVNDVKLVDAAGKTYDADPTATLYASPSNNAWVAAINPGNAIQGPVLFDVPTGTKAASIQVSDNLFSAGKTIRLG